MPRGGISKRSARAIGAIGPGGSAIVPAGTNQSALINGYLAAGIPVELADGEHHLGVPAGAPDPLIVPTGGQITGQGPGTVLIPDWSRAAGDADDPTNDVIEIVGAKNLAKLSTTVSVSNMTNIKTVSFTALGTLAPGDWVAIEGPNATDELGVVPNANLSFSEMVLVDAAWGGANPVTLPFPTLQFHSAAAPAQTAQAVVPVEDVYLSNFAIRAPVASNIAVGVRVAYARNVHQENLWFRGFSRAGYEWRLGSRGLTARDMTCEGDSNALAIHESVMQFQESGMRTLASTGRSHPQGLPRAALNYRLRCTSGTVDDGEFSHVCSVLRSWGGRHLAFSDIHGNDVDGDAIRLRDPTIGTTGAVDTGSGNPPVFGEFQHYCSWDNVTIEDWLNFDNDPNVPGANFGWWLNDTQNSTFIGCRLVNGGRNASTAYAGITYPMIGLMLDDAWDNHIDGTTIEGCNYGLLTLGSTQSHIPSIVFDGANAAGQGSIAIYLNGTGAFGSPKFGKVTFTGWATTVWFGANFLASPDYELHFDAVAYRGITAIPDSYWTDVVVANNATGIGMSTYEAVTFDAASPAGTRRVVQSAGPTLLDAVVVSGGPTNSGTGFILVCPLPCSEAWASVAGAVALGDLLESAVGGSLVVNNGAPPGLCAGRALAVKAAGTAPMRIGLAVGSVTASPTANTGMRRGASGEAVAAWFSPSGTVATIGLLRGIKGSTLVAGRNQANTGNVTALSLDAGNDSVQIGCTPAGVTDAGYVRIAAANYIYQVSQTFYWDPNAGGIKMTLDAGGQLHVGADADVLGTNLRVNGLVNAGAVVGGAGALPALPAGYLQVNINGAVQQIPFYN